MLISVGHGRLNKDELLALLQQASMTRLLIFAASRVVGTIQMSVAMP